VQAAAQAGDCERAVGVGFCCGHCLAAALNCNLKARQRLHGFIENLTEKQSALSKRDIANERGMLRFACSRGSCGRFSSH
jgi:hypothetical protein